MEVETVKKLKADLQEHIKEYKAEQENKRLSMNKQIKEQRGQITDKETQIQTKNQQLKATEDEYDQKLKALQKVYEEEQKKKNQLEHEFKTLK